MESGRRGNPGGAINGVRSPRPDFIGARDDGVRGQVGARDDKSEEVVRGFTFLAGGGEVKILTSLGYRPETGARDLLTTGLYHYSICMDGMLSQPLE